VSEEKKKVLEMVESGRITAEEGAKLLDLVSESPPADAEPMAPPDGAADVNGQTPGEPQRRVRPYWRQAVFVGAIIMIVSGAVLADAYRRSGVSLWTWLFGWLPLFLGLAMVTISAWARTARWVQMRIRSDDDYLVFSFPLPLGLGAAVVSFLRPFVPQMHHSGIDELILALRDGLPDDEPVTIEVSNEDEGEHVEIVID
jgi:hypothetical protein